MAVYTKEPAPVQTRLRYGSCLDDRQLAIQQALMNFEEVWGDNTPGKIVKDGMMEELESLESESSVNRDASMRKDNVQKGSKHRWWDMKQQ